MLDTQDGAGTRIARRRARKRQRRDRRRSFTAALVLILIFGALGGAGWWGFSKVRDFFVTPDYSGEGTGEVLIRVNPGDTTSAIGKTLLDEGVVKSIAAFTEAAAKEADMAANIQPGSYKLRKQMSGVAAFTLLVDPRSKVSGGVTIPEGKSMAQTFDILQKALGIPRENFVAAAADPAALGVPAWGPSLEGFLFPETYHFAPRATAIQVLKTMVEHAKQVFAEIKLETAATGKSPYEILTIASLVEGEGITSDFGKISRVVYNRLDTAPYFLNFDSTTQYWLELTDKGRKTHLTNNELRDPANNYSTTINPGLPPTAIANPGKEALLAALNPEPGPWMYFVLVEKDGRSAFAVTEDEHDKNVIICRERNLGC